MTRPHLGFGTRTHPVLLDRAPSLDHREEPGSAGADRPRFGAEQHGAQAVHGRLPPRVLSCGRRAPSARALAARAHGRWPEVKFRVERDVLAEAVAWAARASPPGLPCRCSPACCWRPTRTACCGCRASTTRSRPGSRSPRRSPTPAASWSPAGCSPRSPGRCRASRSTSRPTAPGWSLTCGQPVHPARRCRSTTTRRCRPCRRPRHDRRRRLRRRPSPRSRSPPAATTRCRC